LMLSFTGMSHYNLQCVITHILSYSSPEQHWTLMPFHAVCSTVKPASCLYGTGVHYGGPNSMSFPQ
jgi:hypothetical protein